MESTQHPSFELLQDYIREADSAQFAELRLHLSGCAECRAQVDAMNALQQYYPWLENPAVDEQLQQQLVDYMEQRLPEDQHSQVQGMLKENPAAMKAALHYASHRAAMQQSVPVSSLNDVGQHAGISLLGRLRAYLADWLDLRAPVWMMAPATAALVLVAIIMLQPGIDDENARFDIVAYQDNPLIQFRGNESLPGIGFFNRADNASAVYDQVSVSLPKPGKVAIQWPEVANAVEYKMRLQAFYQGEKHSLGEVITTQNRAIFDVENVPVNSRYEWILSGQTARQKTFYTSGGFVISKK